MTWDPPGGPDHSAAQILKPSKWGRGRLLGMRQLVVWSAVVFALAVSSPTAPRAWSFKGHRLATGWAIDVLPEPVRRIFSLERAFVVEHSVDPDTWRVVGLRTDIGSESVNHF